MPSRAGKTPQSGSLDAIFRPRSVAVIGASRKRQTIGREILANLVEFGFNGPVMVEGTEVGATLDQTIANAKANREFLEKVFASA